MRSWAEHIAGILRASQQNFLPDHFQDPESLRLAKLIVGFASMGGAFSIVYAIYYLWVGHYDGAFVILVNSMVFLTLPLFCVKKGKIDLGGLVFVGTLTVMFSWLSVIEGGVKGHAVAWLATMPFCSQLLIMNRKMVLWSNLLILIMIAFFSGDEIWGLSFSITYPEQHHGWITLVGYTGLGLFMFTLGAIGEYYRRDVLKKRDQAERELKHAVEKLTRLNLEKNEFLGIAAHDLNNPLSVVYGYAQMMLEPQDLTAEDLKSFAQEISDNSARMRKIIQDVLDVNTIESGEYPLRVEDVEVELLFERCIQTYRKAIEEKGLRLQTELPETKRPSDSGAVSQILDNLVSNAVKYATPGGTIRCSLFPQENGFSFEVYNDGRGFSEEDKKNLFARFSKLSTRPTAGEGSVGLGLSITQKIVGALGGTIECESELNKGALFRVVLPGAAPDVSGDGG